MEKIIITDTDTTTSPIPTDVTLSNWKQKYLLPGYNFLEDLVASGGTVAFIEELERRENVLEENRRTLSL